MANELGILMLVGIVAIFVIAGIVKGKRRSSELYSKEYPTRVDDRGRGGYRNRGSRYNRSSREDAPRERGDAERITEEFEKNLEQDGKIGREVFEERENTRNRKKPRDPWIEGADKDARNVDRFFGGGRSRRKRRDDEFF